VRPGGNDMSNLNAANLSLTPSPPDLTFASTENISNASSTSPRASTSQVSQWNTTSPCAIDLGSLEENLESDEETWIQQAYRQSSPQLTLDPAVLSLHNYELSWDHMHSTSPAEQRLVSEHSISEHSPPSRDPSHSSDQGSPYPRQHFAVLRPALPPSTIMVSMKKNRAYCMFTFGTSRTVDH